VNDSQTIAIGGLVQEQTSETISKVPLLGSIPILGIPFRHKKSSVENKEVIIFITPRLLGRGVDHLEDKRLVSLPKEPDLSSEIKEYYLQINDIIESGKKFLAKGQLRSPGPKEVVLEFTVFSSGTVGEVRVLRSSGELPFDLNAVKLVENLSPFPPFPSELRKLSVTFVVPIRYES
jgi:TonB family protein